VNFLTASINSHRCSRLENPSCTFKKLKTEMINNG
jgi:hypothetical protein